MFDVKITITVMSHCMRGKNSHALPFDNQLAFVEIPYNLWCLWYVNTNIHALFYKFHAQYPSFFKTHVMQCDVHAKKAWENIFRSF